MADLNAKPKRVPRATKRPSVAVPFMPEAPVAPDKPLPELLEEIAHLPIDAPAAAQAMPADTIAPGTTIAEAAAEPAYHSDRTPAVETARVVPESAVPEPAVPEPTVQEDHIMTDTMQNTAETMQANAQDAVAKGRQSFDDMTAFGQGNMEAMVESTRLAVKGVEAMAQARAAFAKQSFEATVQTLKSMSEVRTPTDFFKLQGDYLRSSMDALVAETSRSTEATLKLVGEIAQPIQNRVALAAEKVRTVA